MAWSIDSVLAPFHDTSSASSTVYTFAEAVPVGQWLLGVFTCGNIAMTPTITDVRGNTYQVDVIGTGTNGDLIMISGRLATAIQISDTLTFAQGVAITNRQLHLLSVSGLADTGWFDVGDAAATGSDITPVSASVTAAQNGSLAIGAATVPGSGVTITPDSPWTSESFYAGNRALVVAARNVDAGSAAFSGAQTGATGWRAGIAVYKAATVAPPSGGPPAGSLALLGVGV